MEKSEQCCLDVSGDVAPSDMEQVASRIERLEAELGQQRQNFEQVDRRFDQLGSQLAALCDAISGPPQRASQTPVDEPTADENSTSVHEKTATTTDMDSDAHADEVDCDTDIEFDCRNHADANAAGATEPTPTEVESPNSIHDEAGLEQLLAKLNSAASTEPPAVACDAAIEPPPAEPVHANHDHRDDLQNSQSNELEDLFASLRTKDSNSQDSSHPAEIEPEAGNSSAQPAPGDNSSLITVDTLDTADCGEYESVERTESTETIESNFAGGGCASTEVEATAHEEGMAEVLARMNCLRDLDECPPNGGDDNLAKSESDLEPNTEPVAVAHNQGDGAGEDVQDYMNSLLQRLNGGRSSSTTPKLAQEPKPKAEPPTRKVVEQPTQTVASPLNPDEFVPKRVAPEKTKNLAAMRELANATSRSAVQSSEKRRLKAKANFQLALAGGGIAGAAFMACLSTGMGDMFFYLAVGLLVITAASSYCFAKTNIFGKSAKPTDNDEADESAPMASGLDWAKLGELKDSFMGKPSRAPEQGS